MTITKVLYEDKAMEDQERERYFEWLIDTYTYFGDKRKQITYMFVSKILFNKPFKVIHSMDENRLMDGVALLKDYKEKISANPESINVVRECCILELMIGISLHMSLTLGGIDKFINSPEECMFLLLCNLGLNQYHDGYITSVKSKATLQRIKEDIENVLDTLINKEYEYNGEGGLFPLQNPPYDQREVEIWYQMNSYLNENFDFTSIEWE